MKTRLMIILCVAMGSAAVFFGLSNLTISQRQFKSQQQVQRQDNLQLVFMDTRMKITNIQWEIKKFNRALIGKWDPEPCEDFINRELDFFQQINMKVTFVDSTRSYVLYPVLNKSKKVYTNQNINVNSNEVKVNPFGKLRE